MSTAVSVESWELRVVARAPEGTRAIHNICSVYIWIETCTKTMLLYVCAPSHSARRKLSCVLSTSGSTGHAVAACSRPEFMRADGETFPTWLSAQVTGPRGECSAVGLALRMQRACRDPSMDESLVGQPRTTKHARSCGSIGWPVSGVAVKIFSVQAHLGSGMRCDDRVGFLGMISRIAPSHAATLLRHTGTLQ